jgi:hypothetical protein
MTFSLAGKGTAAETVVGLNNSGAGSLDPLAGEMLALLVDAVNAASASYADGNPVQFDVSAFGNGVPGTIPSLKVDLQTGTG